MLLTYSAFPLPGRAGTLMERRTEQMNEVMRDFAREHDDVLLVDARERFLDLLPPTIPRAAFFLGERNSHPNPRGYVEIARLVAYAFESQGEAGR